MNSIHNQLWLSNLLKVACKWPAERIKP